MYAAATCKSLSFCLCCDVIPIHQSYLRMHYHPTRCGPFLYSQNIFARVGSPRIVLKNARWNIRIYSVAVSQVRASKYTQRQILAFLKARIQGFRPRHVSIRSYQVLLTHRRENSRYYPVALDRCLREVAYWLQRRVR
jgi:hypothetical protein